MMLRTYDLATLNGFEGTQASKKVVHGQTSDPVQVSKWDTLLDGFNNVLEKLGKPVS